jgi:hypothetical protein
MRRIGASSVAPVVAAWKTGDVPLEEYAAGSSGPIP